MAMAFMCDRCGLYFSKRSQTHPYIKMDKTTETPTQKTHVILSHLDRNREKQSLDLCPTCTKSFEHWFDQGEGDSENDSD